MTGILSQINLLKRQIVLATVASGEGHIPSAFSILDIILSNRIALQEFSFWGSLTKPPERSVSFGLKPRKPQFVGHIVESIAT